MFIQSGIHSLYKYLTSIGIICLSVVIMSGISSHQILWKYLHVSTCTKMYWAVLWWQFKQFYRTDCRPQASVISYVPSIIWWCINLWSNLQINKILAHHKRPQTDFGNLPAYKLCIFMSQQICKKWASFLLQCIWNGQIVTATTFNIKDHKSRRTVAFFCHLVSRNMQILS